MKRLYWTVGMAFAGFFLAWKSQGPLLNLKELFLITAWVGCIGYGFGSIFERRLSERRLVVCWAVTIAMVSPLFSPALRLPPRRRLQHLQRAATPHPPRHPPPLPRGGSSGLERCDCYRLITAVRKWIAPDLS